MSWRILAALGFAVAARAQIVKFLGWNYTPFVDPFSFAPFSRDVTVFLFLFAVCFAILDAFLGPRKS